MQGGLLQQQMQQSESELLITLSKRDDILMLRIFNSEMENTVVPKSKTFLFYLFDN